MTPPPFRKFSGNSFESGETGFPYSRSDLSIFQAAITATSRALHSSLEGEVYLDRVTIEVPHTWTEMDCRTPLSMACLTPTSRKVNFL